jgi:DNA-binding CsgD family transcriptional regulator
VVSTRCPSVVGREAEMALLRGALAQAGSGTGSLVVLTGAAGMGKSRLLREVARTARAVGYTAVTGRASGSTRTGTPFAVLTEALLHARRACPSVDLAQLGPWATAVVDLLPLGDQVPMRLTSIDASPIVRAEAVVRMLGLLSESAPLLIGLEDLHWADPDTLSIIEFLAEGIRQYPVLCVATVRSQPPSAALDMTRLLDAAGTGRRVELAALSREQAREMALACRPDAVDGELRSVLDRADGVPLLIEELLAAPGLPQSFADSVHRRLTAMSDEERRVLACAAVVGRRFDWRLLPAATGVDEVQVTSALECGAASQLLDFDGDGYYFRHALTRDAVLDRVLPHVRAELARGALDAVQAAPTPLVDAERELAANLARQAGLTDRTAELLREGGREALRRGALATAVRSLHAAARLARRPELRQDVHAALIEALAQAGRLEECLRAGGELLAMQSRARAESVHTHLALARAAIEATRWTLADAYLGAAAQLLPAAESALTDRWRVLRAEVTFAEGDRGSTESLARDVLASPHAPADARCHAFALLGRSYRLADLDAARRAFADALACAEMADLPLWRLRATHELGTIELFDHAGVARLQHALDVAQQLGALSTSAVVELQLAAAHLFRFDPDRALASAHAALTTADALRADQLRATALVFVAEAHSLRSDSAAMEQYNTLAVAAAPDDTEIQGSVWGARGVAALLAGRNDDAEQAFGRAEELLRPLRHSGPGIYRGLWPLLLAVRGDGRARGAIAAARECGIEVNRANRGMLLLAQAVLAGGAGDDRRASALAADAAGHLTPFPVWSDLCWLLAAEATAGDASDIGLRQLTVATSVFEEHGLKELARRRRDLLGRPGAHPLSRLGVTPREIEILGLVAQGLSNREIAARLTVSPRTVEKHVESLLRKTGTASRTQLVAVAAASASIDETANGIRMPDT